MKAATLKEWGDRTIDEISTDEIRELVLSKYHGRSETHKKAILKFIRGAFECAVEANWVQRNPAPNITWRANTKIKTVLTEEQVKIFLMKARNMNWEWYPHCAMAVYTGMRSGELFALKWDKVNLKQRQILVDASWNNKDGFKDTKSGDDRIVEIAPNLIPLLEELKLSTYQTAFVLPRLGRWSKGEQARELRMFLIGINLPAIRFHDLRATWATQMLSKGIEPIKVMMMGGWKELKTMQIYIRKAGVDIRGITDCLDFHTHKQETAKILELPYKS